MHGKQESRCRPRTVLPSRVLLRLRWRSRRIPPVPERVWSQNRPSRSPGHLSTEGRRTVVPIYPAIIDTFVSIGLLIHQMSSQVMLLRIRPSWPWLSRIRSFLGKLDWNCSHSQGLTKMGLPSSAGHY
ncbi:uncharacterized protein EI97DRAFT_225688 [Westerdykella ornata]|uniref:Uncharacterized protein n=1 Tax=Westerdykella ornata TaxID=318751 RepID=A0A6A6JT57_WESOR|nr:uncharacterized protein EI97DRAFT_225688 [Westerdykella ornata]KAF2279028.1 hypothetical protein EI97DRAFT_225688 [Westerdykella ornata]